MILSAKVSSGYINKYIINIHNTLIQLLKRYFYLEYDKKQNKYTYSIIRQYTKEIHLFI